MIELDLKLYALDGEHVSEIFSVRHTEIKTLIYLTLINCVCMAYDMSEIKCMGTMHLWSDTTRNQRRIRTDVRRDAKFYFQCAKKKTLINVI